MKLPFVSRTKFKRICNIYEDALKERDNTIANKEAIIEQQTKNAVAAFNDGTQIRKEYAELREERDKLRRVLDLVEKGMPSVKEKEYLRGFKHGVTYVKREFLKYTSRRV